jgi:hypothetical protein
MVLPGHIAGGYLATKALLTFAHPAFSATQITWLYVIGIISGEIPDIDLIWFYFVHKFNLANKLDNHRDYVTHWPLLWLVICLLIVAFASILHSPFFSFIGWAILTGTWSHFILDTIEYGVQWLAPFHKKRYAFFVAKEIPNVEIHKRVGSIPFYFEYLYKIYVKNISFYVEIAIVLLAICVAFLA